MTSGPQTIVERRTTHPSHSPVPPKDLLGMCRGPSGLVSTGDGPEKKPARTLISRPPWGGTSGPEADWEEIEPGGAGRGLSVQKSNPGGPLKGGGIPTGAEGEVAVSRSNCHVKEKKNFQLFWTGVPFPGVGSLIFHLINTHVGGLFSVQEAQYRNPHGAQPG